MHKKHVNKLIWEAYEKTPESLMKFRKDNQPSKITSELKQITDMELKHQSLRCEQNIPTGWGGLSA